MMTRPTCWSWQPDRKGDLLPQIPLESTHTPTSTITPTTTERLLGNEIHHNLGWRKHILDSDNSIVKSLNKRLSALTTIQKIASFKSRKLIAEGIFMSKLIYLMPLWARLSGQWLSGYLHTHQSTSENLWMAVCEATYGISQHCSLTQDIGK